MDTPPDFDTGRHALFLDFDGTLVGFADDPAAVTLDAAVHRRLMALQNALAGALAIVSGRRIVDLDRFLAPLRFAAAGVHGLERRMSPTEEPRVLAGREVLDPVRMKLGHALEREPRLRLEDKGTALVLHYRLAPDLAIVAQEAMREAVAGRDDLVVMVGEAIVEVHPAGMDKGRAVASMMENPPFAGRVPVYIGDDTTDEFALAFVRDQGGVSIKVGNAPSQAEFRLPNVRAVHRWIGTEWQEWEGSR